MFTDAATTSGAEGGGRPRLELHSVWQDKVQMMKHVESVHLKTNDPTYGYHCNICNEFCLSYNLLNKHKRVAHRSENTLLWNKL